MHFETHPVLAPWSAFYTMAGSSAAALTGLMFVVISLVGTSRRMRSSPDGISTFSTPTVIHFCVALLISAVLAAPWHVLVPPAVLLALIGLCGIAYIVRVSITAARLDTYTPDTEDWCWYTALPIVAYLLVLGGASWLLAWPARGLYAIGAADILLIFVGIHNAWDVVTYITVKDAQEAAEREHAQAQEASGQTPGA
jgi:hypothetical protein